MFYVNGVFFHHGAVCSIATLFTDIPEQLHFSIRYYTQDDFSKKKTKKGKKFKNDWSFIVQGFILLRTNRNCHVWWEKNSFWLNCDWLRQKHELLISGYFQENCVWTFSLFTTVFGGLIRSTWIIWDLYVCKLKNHF